MTMMMMMMMMLDCVHIWCRVSSRHRRYTQMFKVKGQRSRSRSRGQRSKSQRKVMYQQQIKCLYIIESCQIFILTKMYLPANNQSGSCNLAPRQSRELSAQFRSALALRLYTACFPYCRTF